MAFTLKNVSSKIKSSVKPEDKKEYKKILCQVNKFLFQDEETGFFVFAGTLSEDQPNIKETINGKVFSGRSFAVVGTSLIVAQSVMEGQELEIWGNFEKGKIPDTIQFTAEKIQECIPTTPKAIQLFLGSGRIKGVGPATAKKIVEEFGVETINILDKTPEKLLEIPGVNLKKLEVINQSWKDWRSMYEIIATLRYYDIGDSAGVKIFNHFKERSMSVIKNDPYELTEVSNIGFKTADKIALALGIDLKNEKRINKGISYVLEDMFEKGHTAFPKEESAGKANEFLNVDMHLVKDQLNKLIENGELIEKTIKVKSFKDKNSQEYTWIERNVLTTKKMHLLEEKIADELFRIATASSDISSETYKSKINEFIQNNPSKLDQSQLIAAKTILSNKVSVLTGGPGTGKTHTIKSLLDFLNANRRRVVDLREVEPNLILAAPTGRASKKMEEATKRSSSTIHSLLGYKEGSFVYGEFNKLKGDVFVIDETSMMDVWITASLLKAIPDGAIILFVGDIDQLPSVGAGKVLKDIIESGKIPVARLKEPHRQALNSNIISASHAIINKKVPTLHDINSDSDFVFVEKNNNEDIKDEIERIIKDLLGAGVAHNNIQLLTPKKESEIGTYGLNTSMRNLLNPKYFYYQNQKTKFVPGDRVMQFKNNKELELFNGDMGTVVSLDPDGEFLTVDFDNKRIEMAGSDLNDLNFSYAITIHKSQGSDYPYVIIPLSKSHMFMWDANLLYTAVTRGKKKVILVGDKKTLFFSVSTFKQNERITGLKELIEERFDNPKLDIKTEKKKFH